MTDEFTFDYLPVILDLEKKGLVTRTFRRLDPERQQAIITAILDEAGEAGPQDLNVKRVAERAGVSTGSLYQYFTNRDNLLAFATELATRSTIQLFESYRPYMGQAPLKDMLPMYISTGVDWTETQLGFARFFASAAYHGDPQYGESVVRPIARVMRGMVEDMLRPAVERGETRPDLDMEATARVLHALTIAIGDGLIFPQLMNYYQLTDDGMTAERIYAAFTSLVMFGIMKEQTS
jgi:AcrR family transcriptional regulator